VRIVLMALGGLLVALLGVNPATGATSTNVEHSKVTPRARVRTERSSTLGTRGLETISVTPVKRTRTFLLYVPPGDSASHPFPLVLVYHGADDTALDTAQSTGLLRLAEQHHNMIVAFLQGYDDTWNDDAGNPPAEAAGVDDVAFTTAVLRRIESSYSVDLHQVVATGFSNGAILAELLGCRLAANLTLIVPVEGQLAPTFSSGCSPNAPISVYEIHATADQAIPYAGGTFQGVGGPVSVLSAPHSAARWATLDGCTSKRTASRSGSVLTEFGDCRLGVTVTLNSIQGGSHEWPPNFGQLLVGVMTTESTTRVASTP
jgi:polyhydroxybutyrate depolymerase